MNLEILSKPLAFRQARLEFEMFPPNGSAQFPGDKDCVAAASAGPSYAMRFVHRAEQGNRNEGFILGGCGFAARNRHLITARERSYSGIQLFNPLRVKL